MLKISLFRADHRGDQLFESSTGVVATSLALRAFEEVQSGDASPTPNRILDRIATPLTDRRIRRGVLQRF